MKNFIYSCLSLINALFFILIGTICMMIPWVGEVRYFLVRIILEDALALSIFGLAFVLIGIALGAYTIQNSRKKSYEIQCGNAQTSVDATVIEQYLAIYWKQLFPHDTVASRLSFRHGKIAIAVDLPNTPIEEQRPLLKRIEGDLENLFTTKVGYEETFSLSATFSNS